MDRRVEGQAGEAHPGDDRDGGVLRGERRPGVGLQGPPQHPGRAVREHGVERRRSQLLAAQPGGRPVAGLQILRDLDAERLLGDVGQPPRAPLGAVEQPASCIVSIMSRGRPCNMAISKAALWITSRRDHSPSSASSGTTRRSIT